MSSWSCENGHSTGTDGEGTSLVVLGVMEPAQRPQGANPPSGKSVSQMEGQEQGWPQGLCEMESACSPCHLPGSQVARHSLEFTLLTRTHLPVLRFC